MPPTAWRLPAPGKPASPLIVACTLHPSIPHEGRNMPDDDRPKRRKPPRTAPSRAGVQMNYINLRRALKGKTESGGGRPMDAADRRRIVSSAVSTVMVKRGIKSRAEARRIVRQSVRSGKAVGGYVKGAKKGASEGKNTKSVNRTAGPGR